MKNIHHNSIFPHLISKKRYFIIEHYTILFKVVSKNVILFKFVVNLVMGQFDIC